ncbi:MAG: GMC family oxidoreductase N-terminal domain-containing protein, partial [Anaerolineae bacterium]|nr:GMC family oxidoreductase N-terminal domain-containing protein [Anaerolineae bacterium]
MLRLVAAGYVLAALVYVWVGVQSAMTELAPPMLTATLVTKVLLLALLALTAAGNIRHARVPVYLLIAANLITALIALVLWRAGILAPPMSLVTIPELYIPLPAWLGRADPRFVLSHAQSYDTAQMLQGSVIYDIIVCVVAYYLQWRVEKTQYRFCKFLQPVEYDVVYALADVLIHDGTNCKRERLTPADIANNVDQFLHDFPGKRTATLAMAVRLMEYLPFIWNFATFSYLNAADRRATLEGHFIKSQRNWRISWLKPGFRAFRRISRQIENRYRRWMQRARDAIPHSGLWLSFINLITSPIWLAVWLIRFIPNAISLWRFVMRGLITSVKQLVYTGYYQDRNVQTDLGYVAPSQRITQQPTKTSPNLNVIPAHQFRCADWQATQKRHTEPCNNSPDNPVIIVGTGAAASIIAYYLVHQKWHVLMLERGPYISPAQFSENEVEGSSKLYADGLLQISTNLQLQVAQGRCVGGGTTVNNGICFAPPADIIADWHNRMGGQLDVAQLDAAIAEVESLLHVQRQQQNLNPSGELFVAGVKLAEGDQAEAPAVTANIEDCLGCGLCNTGCQYDRKKSALIWLLPKASQTGRLTIISDCEVTRINTRKSDKGDQATDLECAITSGGQLRLSGCAYIISAGAIASLSLIHI